MPGILEFDLERQLLKLEDILKNVQRISGY